MPYRNRSILTTIIGFLIGCVLYLSFDQSTVYLFLFGGIGYLIGLYLDGVDRKNQIDKYHFTSLNPTEMVFTVTTIPEALIIYSKHRNRTTVLLEYEIKTKPQNFRLSILKNFQEFDFEVTEDSSGTGFVLPIYYPNLNYPSLLLKNTQLNEFLFDIRERGLDFQSAIQKVVPGLLLTPLERSNPYTIMTEKQDYTFSKIFSPPYMKSIDQNSHQKENTPQSSTEKRQPLSESGDLNSSELTDYPNQSSMGQDIRTEDIILDEESSTEPVSVNEDKILNDLLSRENSMMNTSSLPAIPDLTSDEAVKLKGSNNKRFIEFLNNETESEVNEITSSSLKDPLFADKDDNEENYTIKDRDQENTSDNSIKIDYSSLESSDRMDGWQEFNQSILSKIEPRLKPHQPLSEKYNLSDISSQDE